MQEIGKSPDQVDAEAATDEQVMDFISENSQEREVPDYSMRELTALVIKQQERIESLTERVRDLEGELEERDLETTKAHEVIEQMDSGKLAGEAGADILLQLAPSSAVGGVEQARARQIYTQIVKDHRVGKWVKTADCRKWLDIEHNTQVHRAMDTLEEMTDQGLLLGAVEQEVRHGTRCIRLTGSE